MKKLLLALALMTACFAASAQYVPNGTAKRSGSHIKIDGERLSQEQEAVFLSDINGQDFTAQWKRNNTWRKTGIWMTSLGGAAVVGGLGATFVGAIAMVFGVALGAGTAAVVAGTASGGDEQASSDAANEAANNAAEGIAPIINTGLAITGIGTVSMAVGIPMIVVNCKKMNKIVKAYNGSVSMENAPELSLSPAFAYEPASGSIAPGIGLRLSF